MPAAPITPDPGADGWGRPTPGPHVTPPPGPPDADPEGHFRPAAVGPHRTARWFILVGAALLLLAAPLAVPVNEDPDTGPYLLNEAAADSLTAWGSAPLDLAGLDGRCVATGEALLPGTLEASCVVGYGLEHVDLDIVSMAGVDDAALSSGRGLRAILATDVSDVAFRPAVAEEVLHPSLSARAGEFMVSPVVELRAPSGLLDDLPDPRDPGVPADTRPVQFGDPAPGGTPGRYTAAASVLLDGPDGVLYTFAVTGGDEESVAVTADQLWGAVRAA
ncbi:hypothetical protein [Corynebacterium sp.]|uniref:hypothetical protein n=1 Tax=Corynebacterium sp. TaxID=1720 RepID=UPI0025C2AC3C|nr:hypothetical protein [Corynebacterium sp.]